MNTTTTNNQTTALMLLEMGIDGLNPEFGTMADYATAAHSFIQADGDGQHSWPGAAAMVERIRAAARLEERAPSSTEAKQIGDLTVAQLRTLEACASLDGWNTARGIAAAGGAYACLKGLTTRNLLERRLFQQDAEHVPCTAMWRVARRPTGQTEQELPAGD